MPKYKNPYVYHYNHDNFTKEMSWILIGLVILLPFTTISLFKINGV